MSRGREEGVAQRYILVRMGQGVVVKRNGKGVVVEPERKSFARDATILGGIVIEEGANKERLLGCGCGERARTRTRSGAGLRLGWF